MALPLTGAQFVYRSPACDRDLFCAFSGVAAMAGSETATNLTTRKRRRVVACAIPGPCPTLRKISQKADSSCAPVGHKNIHPRVRYTELSPDRFKSFFLSGESDEAAGRVSLVSRRRFCTSPAD